MPLVRVVEELAPLPAVEPLDLMPGRGRHRPEQALVEPAALPVVVSGHLVRPGAAGLPVMVVLGLHFIFVGPERLELPA